MSSALTLVPAMVAHAFAARDLKETGAKRIAAINLSSSLAAQIHAHHALPACHTGNTRSISKLTLMTRKS
jgi:hypothetical protein